MAMPEKVKQAHRVGYRKWLADPQAGAERNAGIVAARKDGATWVECGRRFGVSRTRASQICAKAARRDTE